MSGQNAAAVICDERRQLHEAMRQAIAEVHALFQVQHYQAAEPQREADLAQARRRQDEAVAIYRAHLDKHQWR